MLATKRKIPLKNDFSFASLTIEQITIRIGVAVVAVNKSSEKCHQDEIEITVIHCHTMEKL